MKPVKIINAITGFNEAVGKIVSLLAIPLILVLVFEVVRRYGFNAPTQWAYTLNSNLLGYFVLLGGAYALIHKGFINMDIVYTRFPLRSRAIVDLVTATLIFAFCSVLLWGGVEYAIKSVRVLETTGPPIYFPLYPLRVILPIGVFFLWLQGLAKFIGDLVIATTGRQA